MKTPMAVLVFLLSAFSIYSDGSDMNAFLIKDDFCALCGTGCQIYLGQSVDDLIRVIGKPDQKIEKKIDDTENERDIIIIKYGNLQIGYLRGWKTINYIKFSKADIKTKRGIKPGDSSEAIFRIYNRFDFQILPDEIYGSLYVENEVGIPSTYFIQFNINKGIIEEVEIGINPEI